MVLRPWSLARCQFMRGLIAAILHCRVPGDRARHQVEPSSSGPLVSVPLGHRHAKASLALPLLLAGARLHVGAANGSDAPGALPCLVLDSFFSPTHRAN